MLRALKKVFPAGCLLACLCAQAPAGPALSELISGSPQAARSVPPAPIPFPVRASYEYLDPGHLVPAQALAAALNYYRANLASLGNPRYLSVIDYTRHANEKRFFVVDMNTGAVESFLAAHGRGSDPDHTGYAASFSNVPGSQATSLGIFLTGDTYNGDNGYSLRLYGMSPANSNAFTRAIVIHGAPYVNPANVPLGRSQGCPAVEMGVRTRLINMLKGGSVIYSWHERFPGN
jgi:hypothetical protein